MWQAGSESVPRPHLDHSSSSCPTWDKSQMTSSFVPMTVKLMWNRIEMSMEGAQSQPGCIKVNGKSAICWIKWVVGRAPVEVGNTLITTGSAAMVQVRGGACTVRRGRGTEPLTNRDDTALTRKYCFQLNALLRGSQSAEMNKSFHLWKHSACRAIATRGKVLSLQCTFPEYWKLLSLTSGYLYRRTQLRLHERH